MIQVGGTYDSINVPRGSYSASKSCARRIMEVDIRIRPRVGLPVSAASVDACWFLCKSTVGIAGAETALPVFTKSDA